MADYHQITSEKLHQFLKYEKSSGKVFWKARSTNDFLGKGKYKPERLAKIWNSGNAGNEAFTSVGSHGYKHGSIEGKNVLAHRVVWCMAHGFWPDKDIDHINGDKLDNRIENLRNVNVSVNLQNARGKISNSSGANGVSWDKNRKKWRSRAMVNYKEIYIGRFDNFEDAVAARISVEKNYDFTSTHGDLSHKDLSLLCKDLEE